MKDHNYLAENGFLVPVSQMLLCDILDVLRNGLEIDDLDGDSAAPDDVLERLRIEVLIRELGL